MGRTRPPTDYVRDGSVAGSPKMQNYGIYPIFCAAGIASYVRLKYTIVEISARTYPHISSLFANSQ